MQILAGGLMICLIFVVMSLVQNGHGDVLAYLLVAIGGLVGGAVFLVRWAAGKLHSSRPR